MFFLPLFLICLLQFAHSITRDGTIYCRSISRCCLSLPYQAKYAISISSLLLCRYSSVHFCIAAETVIRFLLSFRCSLTLTFPFTEGIGYFYGAKSHRIQTKTTPHLNRKQERIRFRSAPSRHVPKTTTTTGKMLQHPIDRSTLQARCRRRWLSFCLPFVSCNILFRLS